MAATKSRTCLHLDGTDSHADCAGGIGQPLTTNSFTLEAWVKPSSTGQSQGTGIFSSSDGANGRGTFQIELDGSGNYRFYPYSGQPVDLGPASTDWQHLAITYDNSTLEAYIDGALSASHSLSLPDGIKFYDVTLGKNREECGLVGYWRFDSISNGETRDTSGYGNHGTMTQTVSARTVSASFLDDTSSVTVLEFDGRKDSIKVDNASLINDSECTVELWFKADAAGTGVTDHLVYAGQNGTGFGGKDDLHLTAFNGRLGLYYNKDGDSWNISGGSVQANTWHHAAATWSISDNAVKLYLDGQQVAQKSSFSKLTQSNWNNEVRFGRHQNGDSKVDRAFAGQLSDIRIWHVARNQDEIQSSMSDRLWNRGDKYFAGSLADVRIWNDVRTQDEIRASMTTRLVGDESGLLGYWQLDGTGTDAHTAGQASDLTKHVGTWQVDDTLPVFQPDETLALAFDGTGDYIDCGTSPTITDALTIEAWVRRASGAGDNHIIDCGGGWSDDGYSLLWRNSALRFELQNTAAGVKKIIDNTPPGDDAWHHVAATWDKTTGVMAVYIDGIQAPNTGTFTESIGTPIRNLTLGGNPTRSRYLTGCMADVRIFDTARTATDIAAHMHHRLSGDEDGLVRYYKLDTVDTSSAARNVALDSSGTSSGASHATIIRSSDGAGFVAVTDLDLNTPRTDDIYSSPDTSLCLELSGTQQYIALPQPVYTTANEISALTVEAWVKVAAGTNSQQLIASWDRSDFWRLAVGNDVGLTQGRAFFATNAAGGGIHDMIGNTDIADGQWHCITATYGAGTKRIYIDGVLDAEVSAHNSLGLGDNVTRYGFIGAGSEADSFDGVRGPTGCNARIAEVRLWHVERTAAEIKASYATRLRGDETGLVGYWPLSASAPGGQVHDASGNGYHGTLVNGGYTPDTALSLGTPGPRENAVLSFAGGDDNVNCGTILPTGSYTKEAWIRASAWDGQQNHIISASNKAHGLLVESDGRLSGGHEGAWTTVQDTAPLTADEWTHAALVYDASATIMRLYKNGALLAEQSGIAGPSARTLYLGSKGGNGGFRGDIADARLWHVARTQAEIQADMNRRLWGNEDGLTAYYPLSDGEYGNTATSDATGESDGTITGAVWRSGDGLNLGTRAVADSLQPALTTADPDATADTGASFDVDEAVTSVADADGSSGWLVAQFSAYTLPGWLNTLIQNLQDCFNGGTGTLVIGTDTLADFAMFTTITDLGLSDADVLEIGNFAIELIGLGVKFSNDLSASTQVGLQVSGDINYLGLDNTGGVATTIRLQFFLDSNNKKVGFAKILSDANLTIRRLLKSSDTGTLPTGLEDVLDVLAGVSIKDPAFAFGNGSLAPSNNSADTPFHLGVAKGINFYGTLDLSGMGGGSDFNLSNVLGWLASFLGLGEVLLHGAVRKESGHYYFTVDILIEADLDIFTGKSFNMSYVGCSIGLSMSGTPPEPSLTIVNTIRLTLDYIGAEDLLLSGSTTTDAKSITAGYTLQQSQGQNPDETPGEAAVWHPFNYSEISVQALAIEFGVTFLAPWVDSFGITADNVTIGDKSGSLAIKIDTNDPDEFVFILSVNELTMTDVITVMCPLILLSSDIQNTLDTLLAARITDLELKVIPSPTYIAAILYDQAGVTIAGDFSAWGWGGTVDMNLSKASVDMYATMDRFALEVGGATLLAISGYGDQKDPLLDFHLGTDVENFECTVAASVTLLGVSQNLYIGPDAGGLAFTFGLDSSVIDGSLSCTLSEDLFAASGAISVDLDMKVPLSKAGVSVGDIKLKTGMDVQLAIDAPRSPLSCTLTLDGSFQFQGSTLSIPTLTLSATPGNLSALLKEIEDHILDKADTIFADYIEELTDWANDVAEGVIWFGGEVADVALQVYQGAEDVGIAAYETMNEGVETVSRGLDTAYSKTEVGATIALRNAGYTANEVTAGLRSAYNATEEAIAGALKAVGYSAEEVANALVSVYKSTEDTVEDALKAAGYAASEISGALGSAFNSVGKKLNPSKW